MANIQSSILYEILEASEKAQPNLPSLLPDYKRLLGLEELYEEKHGRANSKKTNKRRLDAISDTLIDRIVVTGEGLSTKTELGTNYYKCYKLLFCAETLNLMMYKRAALYMAEKAAKLACKYYFLQIAFQAYRIIYINGLEERLYTNHIKAAKKFREYLHYYQIEKNLEIEHNSLKAQITKFQVINPKIADKCLEILAIYNNYENKIPSYLFHTYLFFIRHTMHTMLKEHHKINENAQIAYEWFQAAPFLYIPGKLTYTRIQIVYSIQTKQFENAQKLITRAENLVTIKSMHWYSLQELLLLLQLHKREYGLAVKTYFESARQSSFRYLKPHEKERWILYEAYINFIIDSKITNFERKKIQFSVGKFLNELPRYSKDKRAMNIPLLITQMLFLLVRKKYNQAYERIEALEKYATRYLSNNSNTFRSNCFIKMLLVIPKQGFNQKGC